MKSSKIIVFSCLFLRTQMKQQRSFIVKGRSKISATDPLYFSLQFSGGGRIRWDIWLSTAEEGIQEYDTLLPPLPNYLPPQIVVQFLIYQNPFLNCLLWDLLLNDKNSSQILSQVTTEKLPHEEGGQFQIWFVRRFLIISQCFLITFQIANTIRGMSIPLFSVHQFLISSPIASQISTYKVS